MTNSAGGSDRRSVGVAQLDTLYRDLVETSDDLVWQCDAEGRFTFLNAAWETVFGFFLHEMLGRPVAELQAPGTAPDDRLDLGRSVSRGAVRGLETVLFGRGGREVHLVFNAKVLKDESGTVIGTRGTAHDITDRKRAERGFVESERRLRAVIDSAPFGAHLYDLEPDGRLVFTGANRAAEQILGVDHAGFVGKSIEEAFPALVGTEVPAAYRRVAESGERYDTEQIDYDEGGIRGAFEVHAVQTGGKRMAAFFRDITERKRVESKLRASEARFKALFECVGDGLLLAEVASRRFVMANPAICAMLGYQEAELLGLGLNDIHPPEALDEASAAFQRQAAGSNQVASGIQVKRKDGSVFWAEIASRRLTIEGNELLLGSFRDVTEQRALQASAAQADRLASLGTLAAGVGHEINNPLTYVIYKLQSLVRQLPPALVRLTELEEGAGASSASRTALVDDAREALEGVLRIRDVAQSLSTFTRGRVGVRGAVDVQEAVQAALKMAGNEIRHRAVLVKELAPTPLVWGVPGSLAQVFLNMLVNAAHAIGDGHAERNRITVRSWTEAGHAVVEIGDTGHGIPAHMVDRVFEPYFTTKGPGDGSGLGLFICRNIVRDFGGEIVVDSEVGKGTRMRVRLPAAAASSPEPKPAVPEPAPPCRGRVLVVDDESMIRAVLKQFLGLDHEVVIAASGREGLALLMADREFDVILCDLMMPELSGIELHGQLAAKWPEVAKRVVFMTGGAFTERARDYLEATQNLTVDKPFDPAVLRALVGRLVAAARAEGASKPE